MTYLSILLAGWIIELADRTMHFLSFIVCILNIFKKKLRFILEKICDIFIGDDYADGRRLISRKPVQLRLFEALI